VMTPLRDYLVAQGLARVPRVAGVAHPLYIQPRLGAPAPGEAPPRGDPAGPEVDADVVLALFPTGGFSPGPYEAAWRLPTVDLRIRSRKAYMARQVEEPISLALVDKREWMMGSLQVIESLMWRPLQPLGSDAQGFDHVVSYRFQVFGP
jgi:hypothetical protein